MQVPNVSSETLLDSDTKYIKLLVASWHCVWKISLRWMIFNSSLFKVDSARPWHLLLPFCFMHCWQWYYSLTLPENGQCNVRVMELKFVPLNCSALSVLPKWPCYTSSQNFLVSKIQEEENCQPIDQIFYLDCYIKYVKWLT